MQSRRNVPNLIRRFQRQRNGVYPAVEKLFFFSFSATHRRPYLCSHFHCQASWGTWSQTAGMTEWFLESESAWTANTSSRRNRFRSGTARVREWRFIFHPRLLKGSFVWSLIQMSVWIWRTKRGRFSPAFTLASLFYVKSRAVLDPLTVGEDKIRPPPPASGATTPRCKGTFTPACLSTVCAGMLQFQ